VTTPTPIERDRELVEARFNKLQREGRIDLNSGAWDFDSNLRAALCGRCRSPLTAGQGIPYNEFMRDTYRASTRYMCPNCKEREQGRDQETDNG
jgi:RNase P subunit RPR2